MPNNLIDEVPIFLFISIYFASEAQKVMGMSKGNQVEVNKGGHQGQSNEGYLDYFSACLLLIQGIFKECIAMNF